jgi:hypothetical protein
MADFLKGYDVGAPNNIIKLALSHKILIGMVPPYLHDTKLLKHSQQLIENFKSKLSNHVTGLWSNTLAVAKDIVFTFASSQMGSIKGVTKV